MTDLYRVQTMDKKSTCVEKLKNGGYLEVFGDDCEWDADGNSSPAYSNLNLDTLTRLHLLTDDELQARDAELQDVASIAGDRLKEVLMSSDFAQSDPGYPAAIRSICDKIVALLSKGSPDA